MTHRVDYCSETVMTHRVDYCSETVMVAHWMDYCSETVMAHRMDYCSETVMVYRMDYCSEIQAARVRGVAQVAGQAGARVGRLAAVTGKRSSGDLGRGD